MGLFAMVGALTWGALSDSLQSLWVVVLVAPGGIACAVTVLNLLTWPRHGSHPATRQSLSVLIPARNEERNIRAALCSVLRQPEAQELVREIIVCDDQSTDATAWEVLSVAQEDPRVRLLASRPLPAGWLGKPHALSQLVEASSGQLLLFLDADVQLKPGGLATLLSLLGKEEEQVLTAVPEQWTGSFMERLILPLLHLSYVSWLPLNWANRQRDERLVAANGQVLLITAQALLRLGGWERVRHQLVDDVALCRAAKKEGVRVRFVDGYCVAGCRMYRTAAEVWAGFSKNIYPGLGSGVALVFALLLYLAAFVLPYAVLISCWVVPLSAAALQAAVVGVCLNVIVRSALALRFGHSAWAVVLHPLSVLLLSMIAVNSYRWYRTGRVQWTGRTYDLRSGLPSLRAPVPVGSVSTANRSKWMSP